MKKFTALFLILGMLLTALAGCGNSSSESTPTTAATTPVATSGSVSEEAPTVNEEEPIVLRVMITSLLDSADGPILYDIIDQFEDLHPNVTIEPIECAMNDLYTTLLTMATADDLPDIFTNQIAYMDSFVEMGLCADLYPLMGQEWLDGTLPVAIDAATNADGMLVFMPWQNNTYAMIYRQDLFEEKGLEIPETWDEFVEVARALTEDTDGDGVIDRYGAVFAGTRNDSAESRFQLLALTFGAEVVNKHEDGTVTTDIGTENFDKAMAFFIDATSQQGIMPAGTVEIGYSEAYTMCAADQACMFFGASNVFGAMFRANPDMRDKWSSFPMPHAEGVEQITFFDTLGMSVSSSCEHPEMAAEFLRFLTNAQNSVVWNEGTGRLPCQIEALNQIISNGDLYVGFAQSSDFAKTLPSYSGTAELRDAMGECWQSVIAEGVSLEDALAKLESKAAEVIANN